jgi:hypothetical protein
MKYSDEIKEFIAKNAVGKTNKELVKLLNSTFDTQYSEGQIKSYKSNHSIKSGTIRGVKAGSPTKLFSENVRLFISKNHKGIGPKEMCDLLNAKFGTNYTQKQINAFYKNNHINSGLTGHFNKGHVPTNAIKKGQRLSAPTEFKKGDKPHNWVPIGSERINGDGYTDIKVAEGLKQKNWRGKHLIIYESVYGKIPAGHVIIFGDGDKTNFDIENLLLVTKAQLAVLNRKKLIQNNAELTRVSIKIADIYSSINKKR